MIPDRPLTVAVAGYFLDDEYDETVWCSLVDDHSSEFDLIFIDPYCSEKRHQKCDDWNKFTNNGKESFRAFYFPYQLPPMPRRYDWAIWNTPFLLTGADRVLRYQQWRFISEDLIDFVLHNEGNLAFQRNARVIGLEHLGENVWDASLSDGRILPYFEGNIMTQPVKKEFGDMPYAAYGDWCITVNDFIAINGIDEIASAIAHYEDIDMEIRWSVAHRFGKVQSFALIHDAVFRVEDEIRQKLAGKDQREYKFGRENLKTWVNYCSDCQEAYDKISVGEDQPKAVSIGRQNAQEWYKCHCGGVFHKQSHPHYEVIKKDMRNEGIYRASLGVDGRFGRNLQAIREDCMKLSSYAGRVELINQSWNNERYLR